MRTLARAAQSGLVLFTLTQAGAALAQQPAPAPLPVGADRPVQPQALQQTNGMNHQQNGSAQPSAAGPGTGAQPEQIAIDPRGLTASAVGERARKTSYSAKAAEESLRAAAARVDQAWANYLPRLTGKASYTRLSGFTPPSLLGSSPTSLTAVSNANLGPPGPGGLQTVNTGAPLIALPASAFSFPLVLDNYNLTATIAVPISDYFFRIGEGYTAATSSEDAARYDFATQGAIAEANGKASFYTWLRAKGAVNVAAQALADQKTHLEDAKNQFTVGNASKADVLRAETGVASAELALERSKNLEELTARQVKVAIHAGDNEPITTSEDVMTRPSPVAITLAQAVAEAQGNRLEIKSLAANAEVMRQQGKIQKAGNYPNVSAFADGIYANPNTRIFPLTSTWFPTWDVGAQLTWSPNDLLTARGGVADYDARAAALEAQQHATADGIDIEVTQAWQAVKENDYAIETTARQVASAVEAYRVARELFNAGRATSTTLTDAETDLVRARLEVLNANADAKIARVRLDHALGRDAHVPPAPQH